MRPWAPEAAVAAQADAAVARAAAVAAQADTVAVGAAAVVYSTSSSRARTTARPT